MDLSILNITYIGILLVLIIVILYISWKRDENARNIMVLQKDGITASLKIDKSIFKKIINSSCNGVMRGAFIGYLTGGPQGAISGSIVYGLANPILTYTQHNLLSDEEL